LSDEGLIAAIIVIAVINLITAIIHVYVSSSLLQGLLKPRLKLGLVRPLLQFSRGMVVSYLVGIGLGNAERFFLAHYESVRSVAHYSVAQTVVALISTVPITLNQVLLPAFSQMQVEPGRQALQRLYKQCLRTGILLLIPIMFLLAAGAKDFFTLWAGPEYGLESTRIFYIILCGVGFSSIAYIPFYLLTSLGRTGIIARCRLFQLPLYLIFAAALTYRFGVVGASLVWALFSISDAILLFMFAKRITGFPLSLLPDRKLSLVTAVILLVVILVALNIIIIPITVKSLIVVSTLLLYGGLVWSSILQYEEKVWIKTKMQVYLFQLRRYITT
jgi:O-antigen/teichoic acid export membrane protein